MKGKKPMLFLTTYFVNQQYGGPEEGGWWYSVGEPIAVHGTFFNREKSHKAWDELQAHIDATRNDLMGSRAKLGSVICEGRICVRVEPHPPQHFPQRRPHYE